MLTRFGLYLLLDTAHDPQPLQHPATKDTTRFPPLRARLNSEHQSTRREMKSLANTVLDCRQEPRMMSST